MKVSVKYWNIRALILGIMCLILGVTGITVNFTTKSFIIVSVAAMFVYLVVCLMIKPMQNDIKDCGVPIIRENIDGLSINYEIPSIEIKDVKFALEQLEEWKKVNNFNWAKSKDMELIVSFKDIKKTGVTIIELKTSKSTEKILSYSGLFKYYMESEKDSTIKRRKFKINDIQLGQLSTGVIECLDDVANKKCNIVIRGNTIIKCDVIGE